MKNALKSLLLVVLLCSTRALAITWDEPWAKEVIKGASSFVLAKVVSTDEEKGITINIIKTLGGKQLTGTVLINNFYLLRICSSSGDHGPEFHTSVVDSCYFFISQNEKGEYCIATPTAGFEYVQDGEVIATYRHTYHQAAVPVKVYEMTMTAIFNRYHDQPFDKGPVQAFANEYLQKKPAGFGDNEIKTFFLQHVALECVYHLKLEINEKLVLPFLNDKKNFHHQVSAARAMSAFDTQTNKEQLLTAIADTTRRDFVRVMCVWSLGELQVKDLKPRLAELEKTAPTEDDGFGGNIMDSRICTDLPSLQEALNELIAKL